ncbi:hypothetical protein M0804_013523 [Polistes exclamans]|nr:hypothetical protein M0804_013523 [Polistes exclamans]
MTTGIAQHGSTINMKTKLLNEVEEILNLEPGFRIPKKPKKVKNPDLIVTRSDKGKNTVIMKKDKNLKEIEKLLENTNTYSLLNNDPPNKFEKMANKLLTKLQNESIISERVRKKLRSYNSVTPKLYRLRKTHKKECTMRSVVSSIELVIKTIEEIWDEFSKCINVQKKTSLELIKFCFKSSYFRFNGVFYQQLDGSSMGNPASPLLANIVMNYILKKLEGMLPFQVPFLKVYMDDIVTATPKDEIKLTIKTLNSVNKKIQFPIKVENNKTLSFPDFSIIRKEDGFILTDRYVKPTSSGRCLNYKSNHPISQKIGFGKGLLFRALTLSSKEFYNNN